MFTDMNTIYNARECGGYKIKQVTYTPKFFHYTSTEFMGQKEGDIITVLHDLEKGEIVMSDSMMERKTNTKFVKEVNGDVLIGGLGLGMIILAIQNKAIVKSITVVELDQILIDFIMEELSPHLNDKVSIVCCDINDFIPTKKYDTIYCDIWNDVSGDNWDEMKSLTKKFKYSVNRENPNSSLDHWRKKDMQRLT